MIPYEPSASPDSSVRGRGYFSQVARLVLRGALLVVPAVWLAGKLHPVALIGAMGQLGFVPLVSSLALVLLCFAAGALRWQILLRAYGGVGVPRFGVLLRHLLVGFYFNLLPGSVAGEAVRAHRVRKVFADGATTYLVVLADRLMGLAGLAALAAVALCCGDLPIRLPRAVVVLGILLTATAALGGLLAPAVIERSAALRRILQRLPGAGAQLAALRAPHGKIPIVTAGALSLCTQICVALACAVLVIYAAPVADPVMVIRLAPFVVLLTFIPLTPGGFGQREAVFAATFALAGAPEDASVVAGLALFAVGLPIALAGAACLALERLGVFVEPAFDSSSK